MDDAPDSGYSRAPELEDLVSLCHALNEERVRYLLIGGFTPLGGEVASSHLPNKTKWS